MGKIVSVYRIVGPTGKGFYTSGFYGNFSPVEYWYPELKNLDSDAIDDALAELHPHIPDRSLVYEENNPFVFGCSTAKDLLNWFPEKILKEIEPAGGRIRKFSIDEGFVIDYPKQCIFQCNSAQSVINVDASYIIKHAGV
jgi:hypothetical protein